MLRALFVVTAGEALVFAGLWLMYQPAALIVLGVQVVLLGLLVGTK